MVFELIQCSKIVKEIFEMFRVTEKIKKKKISGLENLFEK